jgi:Collagen-binding surface adhesin SpaP (antigen I/II family)
MSRKRAAVVAAVVLCLAGCAGQLEGTAAPAPAATTPPAITTPAPSTAAEPPPVPVDGTNVRACLDGNCAITVSGPIDIPLDGRAGASLLEITDLTTDRVRIRTGGTTFVSRPGSGSMTFSGKAGAAKTRIRVAPAPDGTFVLELTTS